MGWVKPSSDAKYPHYGGRGITVCERWNNYSNFLLDMGECPTGKTIDRINNNGHYSPDNCRWATALEQMNNGQRNVFIEYENEKHTISEWSKILNINYPTLWKRLKDGWSIKEAFITPICKNQFDRVKEQRKGQAALFP